MPGFLVSERPMTRRYPNHPIVGVGVVVWKDGKVLLIRRAKPPRKGQWSLPGGRQKLGESVRETAAREVREEAGIEISVGPLLDVVDAPVRDGDGLLEYHYTLIEFEADWRAGEARPGADATAVAWTGPEEIAKYVDWHETVRVVGLSAGRRAQER